MNNKKESSLYYSSLTSESPSVRGSISKHASRLSFKSNQSRDSISDSQTIQSPFFTSQLQYESIAEEIEETEYHNRDDFRDSVSVYPCGSIYGQFFEKFQTTGGVFDLMAEFEDIASDHLMIITEMITSKVRQMIDRYNIQRLQCLLRLERNSWRLMRGLMNDRMAKSVTDDNGDNDESLMLIEDMIVKQSDKTLINRLFDRNSALREMQLIIDWLEANESEDMEMDQNMDCVEFYSEGPYAWENTLHSLNKSKREESKSITVCPRMDPDAPIRHKRPHHHLDKEDDDRLLRQMFHLVRAGQLHSGKQLAEQQGHHWLSAALEGWLLHHDPNYDSDADPNETLPIEGNAHRDLWKYVCWRSSQTDCGVPHYERTLMAVLSGNLSAVLLSPLCQRWSDVLWAHLKCSLDVHIETALRETIVGNPESRRRWTVDLSDDYFTNMKTVKEIFSAIESIPSAISSLIEEKCHNGIQKFLIINDLDALIDHMHHWSDILLERYLQKREQKDQSQSQDDYILQETESRVIAPQLLRFFAHMVLVLKRLGFNSRPDLSPSIIQSYITYLIHVKETRSVCHYCAHLPKRSQIETMTKLLETIEDTDDRKMALIEAQSAKLDIENITLTLVDTIRTRIPMAIEVASDLVSHTTDDDYRKMNALEWLLMSDINDSENCQYTEALKQGNALLRMFILSGKIDAAFDTVKKLPADIIDKVFRENLKHNSLWIREHLCHLAYLQSWESFTDWQHCYHNSQPKEPKPLPSRQLRFTEKIAIEHQRKQYEQEMRQWQKMIHDQGSLVASKIENVLLFPDGGWMCDPIDDNQETDSDVMVVESSNESREYQMHQLRLKCIPQLVFILHSVLHSAKNYHQCLQIADIVASETHSLYQLFNTEQLQQLLTKLRESAVMQMEISHDPLGYDQNQ